MRPRGAPVPIGYLARYSLTIAGDGTLYFGDDSSNLVAMTGAGSIKWSIPLVAQGYPVEGLGGTIFTSTSSLGSNVDTSGVYASNPDGGAAWGVTVDGGLYTTNPAVAVDGTVRLGAMGSGNDAPGVLYKIDPSLRRRRLVQGRRRRGDQRVRRCADDRTTYVSGSNAMTVVGLERQANGATLAQGCSEPTIDQNGDVYAVCYFSLLTSFDRNLNLRWPQVPIPGFLRRSGGRGDHREGEHAVRRDDRQGRAWALSTLWPAVAAPRRPLTRMLGGMLAPSGIQCRATRSRAHHPLDVIADRSNSFSAAPRQDQRRATRRASPTLATATSG